MKKLIVLALILAVSLTLAACVTNSNNNTTTSGTPTSDTSDSPLVGTWYGTEQGVHGNAIFAWSFGEDGRFAYLFSAIEPPQAGGTIEGSVRERYMQGNFRESNGIIELFNVRLDDYFSWGDKWRYFKDRDPEALAQKLLTTSLKDSESIDDFTVRFELKNPTSLHLVVDLGDFPDQYTMDFDLVGNRS